MATTQSRELIFPMLASPAAIGMARTLTEARIHNWGNSGILDDALLIASELVTNAAEATPGKKIVLQLSKDAGGIIIAVWDSSMLMPEPRPIVELTLDDLDLAPENYDDNGGRGLALVQSLAASCGITRDPKGGKWIWARCPIP
jgi:anti-sigma regulatory factor (Ser/Thr protein kinase)